MEKDFLTQFKIIVEKFDEYILNIDKKVYENNSWKLKIRFKGDELLFIAPEINQLKIFQEKCIEVFKHYNGPFPQFKNEIFEFIEEMEAFKFRVFWTNLELGLVYMDSNREIAINIFVSNYFYPDIDEENNLSIIIDQERYNGSLPFFKKKDPTNSLLKVVKKILKESHNLSLD
jgi:hypothetical protein